MKKYLSALSLLTLFSLSSAVKADANWNGIYGGVGLGWGVLKSKRHSEDSQKTTTLKGWTYGLEVGGGAAVMPSLYVGANFSMDFSTRSNKETTQVDFGGDEADFSLKIKEKAQYAGTLQIGIPVCNFMPFAEIGYNWGSAQSGLTLTQNGQDITDQYAQANQTSPKHKGAIKGPIFGVGLKYQPTKNMLLAVSYRHGANKIKWKNSQKKLAGKNDSVRLSASYLFNF